MFSLHPVEITDSGLDRALMDMLVQECKRMEPVSGSLRKRYNLSKLVEQLTAAGAPAISLNSDGVLFGGSMVDIAKVREASDAAAVAESLNASDGPSVGSPTLPVSIVQTSFGSGRSGGQGGAIDGYGATYIRALKDTGAFDAIVGGGIATVNEEDVANSLVGWSL